MEDSDSVPGWLLPGEFLTDGGSAGRAPRTARDWIVDTTIFAGAVVLGLVMSGVVQKYDHPSDGVVAADLLLGALACLALWWRRRWPLAVALLTLPAAAVSSSAFGAGIVITMNLALRAPWRRSIPMLGLLLAASLLGVLLLQGLNGDGYFGMAFAVVYYLASFAWGSTLRARRLWALTMRREAELERERHARRLAEVRRAEREAIAREMHDVLAHRISLLSVHAGALAYRVEQSAAGQAPGLGESEIADSAQIIRDNAHQALGELHDVLLVLRDDSGDEGGEGARLPQPRLADVPELLAEARAAGQEVEFHDELSADAEPRQQVQRTVYRVVQEGLTNARKHAPGMPVMLRLGGQPGSELTIEVVNRLPEGGSKPGIPGTGAGLVGLAERVRLDGGVLEQRSESGVFTLRATLPWPAPAQG